MIQHWVPLVVGEEAGQEGFRRSVQWLREFLNANDGLLDSLQPARFQAALNFMAVLFRMVGLWNNINKTVGMV